MTPGLLQKIQALVKDGATIVGNPPVNHLDYRAFRHVIKKFNLLQTKYGAEQSLK